MNTMTDIQAKKMASLFVIGLVFAGTAFSFAGVGAVQLLEDGTVMTQQDSIQICETGGDAEGDPGSTDDAESSLQSLLSNLFTFIIYAGTIGAFAATIWNYAAENLGMDVSKVISDDGWSGPMQKALMMYVIIYGGGIAMNIIFGIDVTCTLPGFPGA